MTNHTARLYALVGAVLVFFVAWATIAAHPWAIRGDAVRDPRLAALRSASSGSARRRSRCSRSSTGAGPIYRAQLALRKREIAAVDAAIAKARGDSLVHSGQQAAPSSTCPRRQPRAAPSVRVVTLPPADDHEDLVMQRRALPRDGHRGRAAPGRRAERRGRASPSPGPSGSSSGSRRCCRASAPTPSSRRSTAPACSTPGTDLVAVTRLAVEARERTGGRFDPTVHDALVAAGYDRTFDEVARDGGRGAAAACGGEVRIDGTPDRARARLPPRPRRHRQGLRGRPRLHPARDRRPVPRQRGRRPRRPRAGSGPSASRPPTASSRSASRTARSPPPAATAADGTESGKEVHHLIDPATGTSAESDLLRVTVVAATAVDAEVLAKAIFLGAPAETPAVLVTADGRTVLAGGLE